MSLYLFNAQSIIKKLDELCYELSLLQYLPNVVLVTETWLDEFVILPNFFTYHYHAYRKDRNGKSGGVVVLIDKNLMCQKLILTSMKLNRYG